MNIHEVVVAANQSQHLSTVIGRCRRHAKDGNFQVPAQLNAPVNSAHSLKLFYFISWWNHAWN